MCRACSTSGGAPEQAGEPLDGIAVGQCRIGLGERVGGAVFHSHAPLGGTSCG